jgi:methionine synthase I (cobalamin-dependent)
VSTTTLERSEAIHDLARQYAAAGAAAVGVNCSVGPNVLEAAIRAM